jgi:hypothetical protein
MLDIKFKWSGVSKAWKENGGDSWKDLLAQNQNSYVASILANNSAIPTTHNHNVKDTHFQTPNVH